MTTLNADIWIIGLVALISVLAVIAISVTVDWLSEMLEDLDKEQGNDRANR